jgi:Ca2+/Na+ antiporter
MNSEQKELTAKEMKSYLIGKTYAFFCIGLFVLILLGFFRNLNWREEILYLLFFLVLSFYLWWLPYDTKASNPELTNKQVIMREIKNPAIISILLSMLIFIPSAIYSLVVQ